MSRRISLSRLFRPSVPSCLLCGRDAAAASSSVTPPVVHPEACAILRCLCRTCAASIPWITAPVCRICGRSEACPDCPRRTQRHVAFCRSAVRYNDRMREWLALYKFRGSEKLAPLFAAMLAYAYERMAREAGNSAFHAITAVPLASARLEERGFNQAEQLARQLAQWFQIPYVSLLGRTRHTRKQSQKDRRSRLQDMQGMFALAAPRQLQGLQSRHAQPLRILLVDDIYTTGSTINECAKALRSPGSHSGIAASATPIVYGLLWARS